MAALEGIRILELSDGWTATTLAGRLLAELGAQVVKVEPPAGDCLRQRQPMRPEGVGYAFELASALKDSVVTSPQDLVNTVDTLAGHSDGILIEAESWRQLEAQGMRQDSLCRRFPHLVVCLTSPFGLQASQANGPWSELTLQAGTGLMATTGFPDDPPMRCGAPAVTHGSAVLAAIAVLAALYERQRSGRGQVIDLAGYDVGLSFLGTFLPSYFRHGRSPQRIGNRHPLVVPWDTYPARDGWVMICSMGDSSWLRLLEVLGRADLKTEARFRTAQTRFEHAEEIDSLVTAWTQQHRIDTIMTVLTQAGVAVSPIMPVDQFLSNAYCQERRLRVRVPHPVTGEVDTLGPLFKMDLTPGVVDCCAPALGQRSLDELLAAGAADSGDGGQDASSHGDKPLAGIRIVEMGAYTAVPYGTRLLALLGAEVIKVEPPQGDPLRRLTIPLDEAHPDAYGFHLYNTGKKSVTLNPESDRGRALLHQLIRTSHVFAHNLSHDLIERLGLTAAALRQAQPGLIYCVVSGFGQQGGWRERRAFDTILQAFGGIMDLTGAPERPPVKVGISVVDLFGALFATAAILAALYHRHRHGDGQFIDVALGDVAAWLTCEAWPWALAGEAVSRVGNRHRWAVPHNLYRTRDRDVVVAVARESQWQALLRLMQRQDLLEAPQYATLEARQGVREEVDRLVQGWLIHLSSAEVVARCQAAGVPAARIQEVGEAVEHPLAGLRQVIVRRQGHRFLGAPFQLSRTPIGVEALAPALGQHNHEVYAGLLGLTPGDLAALEEDAVVSRVSRNLIPLDKEK